MESQSKRLLVGTLLAALCTLAGCTDNPTAPPAVVDLEPFISLARSSDCADVRNRLFLIDEQVVFWDREASCVDAAYAQRLYGSTPDRVLCYFQDSIAGPMKLSRGRYQMEFEIMLENLDQPDLGLGPMHSVEEIAF
jgi:hypothetical protein